MRRYILLCTLQATGTWWTIETLKTHPYIGGAVNTVNLLSFQNRWPLQGHWAVNKKGDSFPPSSQITLLYCHFKWHLEEPGIHPHLRRYQECHPPEFCEWVPQASFETMMLVTPTLSPLRDPLLGMIRAFQKMHKLNLPPDIYDMLINEWVHVARRGSTFGVHFWQMEPFDREGFRRALSGVGLPWPDSWSIRAKKRVNATRGECVLREYYREGDRKSLERALPQAWKRLREEEPVLRPFLERYGFRDLLWWTP